MVMGQGQVRVKNSRVDEVGHLGIGEGEGFCSLLQAFLKERNSVP